MLIVLVEAYTKQKIMKTLTINFNCLFWQYENRNIVVPMQFHVAHEIKLNSDSKPCLNLFVNFEIWLVSQQHC